MKTLESTPPISELRSKIGDQANPDNTRLELVRLNDLLETAQTNEKEARQGLKFLHSIINLMPIGLTVRSQDGKCVIANETANLLLPAVFEAPSQAFGDSAKPSDGRNSWITDLRSGVPYTTEERLGEGDNEKIFLSYHKPVRILGEPLLVSASIDFTERKRAEDELSQRAYLDELTGLPNRGLIQDYIERLICGRRSPDRFALGFIDLDNFKHINDYYTHAIGDALLQEVAKRITGQIRASDVLGRISGDEFLMVIHPLEHDEGLSEIIERIVSKLTEAFFIEEFEIFTSASIGLSIYPEHGQTYETLRRSADTAMYCVKAEAKGGVALFDSSMGRLVTARMAQEQRLRLAARDNRFCCAFQPKVDLRTEEVVGLEALIRLRDDDGEIHAPSEFIELAIELGLIDDLTRLALIEIVKSMPLLDQEFGASTSISINIAARQAGDANFMRSFCDELVATDCAGRFMIEVTEDAFIAKNAFQSEVLPMLRAHGIKVSIDDFGVGYSSLATLADITADEIKIDRSFITNIHERPRSQSVLKAIEALSDALEMTVIAEGVETYEELVYLQAATRIRYGQGYYFAKPLFIEDLASTKYSSSRSTVSTRISSRPAKWPRFR